MYYRFSPDASLTFATSDFDQQEEVLDVLEDLLAETWKLQPDAASVARFDTDVFIAGARHTVFLNVMMIDGSDLLVILGLAVVKRPHPRP